MKLHVTHETIYSFDAPMRSILQSHRLTPSSCANQTVLNWNVEVEGAEVGSGFRDGAGDWTYTATRRERVDGLVIRVSGEVETFDQTGVLRGHRESVPPLAYLRDTRATAADQALRELTETALEGLEDASQLKRAHALSAAVADAIAYVPGKTEAATTAAEAVAQGEGVCADHTHALIACALIAQIPARYVVGYLHSTSDGKAHEASHAWAELYIDTLGWVGFDAANRCCPDELYIRLCSGFDALDAAPIRGVAQGEGAEELQVNVAVMSAQQ